ncbi:DNase I-like protein [Daldinia caldariorum]|uniref:DNase I-like protein n=1 Tax=Daldinia caldariorum TaxID=326644 RepID=UPI0020084EB5|nr:DNase I-like protein [Daldinia caldariorum]KAI1462919.1 DNase I-like protein [Daldinia caldariorum]
MDPVPTLDVFILTFNAAKRQIHAPVFARHLYNAFGQNASRLPELVVISLQEMAPSAQAFIGSYMLNPYFQRYESAVNLAAAKFAAEVERQNLPKDHPYTLVTMRNVGMTGILLFARDPDMVKHLRATEIGFGAGGMANKGAVGLRLQYNKRDADGSLLASTELTFVSAHLAAMEWNLEKRNKNWESIASGLVFDDPKKYAERQAKQFSHRDNNDNGESEAQQALLSQDRTEKSLHDISIYKPSAHLFIAGDLNYRISDSAPALDSVFPDRNPDNAPESPNHFSHFLAHDQLTAEKAAGRALHGLSEAKIKFPPTYKLVLSPKPKPHAGIEIAGDEDDDMDEVEWSWAPHRWPSWCDRILFQEIPWWAREIVGNKSMDVLAYNALPPVRSSDHKAVFLRVEVPMLENNCLIPPNSAVEVELRAKSVSSLPDPRVLLPFPIDVQSWERRAQIRKWESTIGWSMLISQSKEGLVVFITLLLVGLGTWWYRSR